MLEWAEHIDYRIFEIINQKLAHSNLDLFMETMSNKFFWIPFYALILFFLIRQFKTKSWIYILALIASVASSDLISSKLMKPGFKRTRPCNIAELNPRLPVGKSPSYGFVSSHAANHASIAAFVIMAFSLSRWKKACFIIWAFLIAYSRIYLGKHFFFDVFFGALLGVLLAYFWYYLAKYFYKNLKTPVKEMKKEQPVPGQK